MKNREDKIISIINDNVDIDLKENFQLINARKNESMNKNVRTKLHKKFSFGLVVGVVVIIIIVVPVILIGMPAKKAMHDPNDPYPNDDMEGFKSEANQSSLYTDKIIEESNFSTYYVKGDYLSKQDMEVLFSKYQIDSEILEEVNSYSLVIGKKNDKEYLVYTNGILEKEEEISASYSIYDIYKKISARASDNISFVNLKISDGKIVYYTYKDGKLYEEAR